MKESVNTSEGGAPKATTPAVSVPVAGVKTTPTPAPVVTPAPVAPPVAIPVAGVTQPTVTSAQVKQEVQALVQAIAQVVINSPVITIPAAGVAPDTAKVQAVITQVASSLAPIVAPSIPQQVISQVIAGSTNAIVSNSDVIASDTGVTVSSSVVKDIVTDVKSDLPTPAVVSQYANKLAVMDAAEAAKEPAPQVPAGSSLAQGATGATGPANPISPITPVTNPVSSPSPYDVYTQPSGGPVTLPVASNGAQGSAGAQGQTGESDTARAQREAAQAAIDAVRQEQAQAQTATGATGAGVAGTATAQGQTGAVGTTGGTTGSTGYLPTNVEPDTANSLKTLNPQTGISAPTGFTAPQMPILPTDTTTGAAGFTGATGAVFGASGDTGTAVPTGTPSVPTGVNTDTSNLQAVSAAAAAADKAAADAQATAAQNQARENAITFLTSTFSSLGLGTGIASAITNLVQQGYSADTIQLIAQDPNSKDPLAIAFQQRFPANAERLKAGLSVLSPAEYIATERSYRQIMQSYGLPKGFYDQTGDFTKLIASDISPTELNGRVQTAAKIVNSGDNASAQMLQNYYGLDAGHLIAHVLDPEVATPIIEKQVAAAQVGGAALNQGYGVNQATAEQLANAGVSQSQAQQGFGQIAGQLPATQALAARFASIANPNQVGTELQASTFGQNIGGETPAQAEERLRRLKQGETNLFSGSAGAGKGSLYISDTSGLS